MRNLLEPRTSLSLPTHSFCFNSLPSPTITHSSRDFITKFKFGVINRSFLFSYISFPLFTFSQRILMDFPSVSSLSFLLFVLLVTEQTNSTISSWFHFDIFLRSQKDHFLWRINNKILVQRLQTLPNLSKIE